MSRILLKVINLIEPFTSKPAQGFHVFIPDYPWDTGLS
jgi:hypothetical protein